AKANIGQHTSKRGLTHFQRITPQVVGVQLDQVESIEEGVTVMASVADTVERGNAVIVTHNGLDKDGIGHDRPPPGGRGKSRPVGEPTRRGGGAPYSDGRALH